MLKKGSIALGLLTASAAFAFAEEPLRLIETAPGKRAWMTQQEIHEISRRQHESGRCGGFMDVTDFPRQPKLFLQPVLDLAGRVPRQQAKVDALLPELSAQNLHDTVNHLSTAFPNRYYQNQTGVDSQNWLKSRYEAFAAGRSDITVKLESHSFRQPSVIARIEGATKPDEIVIVGGHADSINQGSFFPNPGAHAPGADDNASGSSTVLETFRVLAQSGFRPDRSIEFMAYAAEEVGLLGSQAIARRYQREGKKVAAVMQLDMTMFPNSRRELVMISDHTHRDLNSFTKMLIDTYVKMPWREEPCGYACSDHASWTSAGYASTFPFESPTNEMNPNIHSVRDTLDILDADFGLHFAKLALSFAVELSAE